MIFLSREQLKTLTAHAQNWDYIVLETHPAHAGHVLVTKWRDTEHTQFSLDKNGATRKP